MEELVDRPPHEHGSSALLQQKNGMLLRVGLFLVRLRKAVAAALAITDTTQSAAFEAARAAKGRVPSIGPSVPVPGGRRRQRGAATASQQLSTSGKDP